MTAVLGSLVQGQVQAHYAHLAEQIIPGTSKGQFLLSIQAQLQARGMDVLHASHLAIIEVARLVQRQAYSLALQDGYRFTFFMLIPAILAILFVRAPRVRRPEETLPGEIQSGSRIEGGIEELMHPV